MLRKGVTNGRSKLSSVMMKKDKSKNSTYILVNRVRRCSVRRSLSSLFLLALFGARREGHHSLSAMMMIRTRALTTFFVYSLSLVLNQHASTDNERGISSRTRLDRKHRTRGQSQPRPLSNDRGERCSQGVKNQT